MAKTNSNPQSTNVVTLGQDHDLVVREEVSSVMIGGESIKYKHFTVPKSAEMQKMLNQQAIIQVAAAKVSDAKIEEITNLVMGLVTQGEELMGKKSLGKITKVIMGTFISPNPIAIFGGECDPEIDKKVCSGAVMARITTVLPEMVPTIFLNMGNLFSGDDEPKATDTGADKILL